jgi:CRISPR-associated protein Cmr2
MSTKLHFTFGPVQGFVAQARRTRDLYAGSLILSRLAFKAMWAVQGAGGRIVLPDFATLEKLVNDPENRHAIAPNRFVAEFSESDEQAAKAGEEAAKALQKEWCGIADSVWTRYLAHASGFGNETRNIWVRQVEKFWEIAWAVGEESDLLDRRKNWRTPPLTIEGGDHCTLMGQWQELSGFLFSKQRQEQTQFWKAVCEAVYEKTHSKFDLERDERLCAIAMVKRFYLYVSEKVTERDVLNWPSTVSIAALPWQRNIRKKIGGGNEQLRSLCVAYADKIKSEPGAFVSSAQSIPLLANFTEAGEFNKLSGNFLNRAALQNNRATQLKNDDHDNRKDYLEDLVKLYRESGDRAGNFYALLIMDGDRMGKLVREYSPENVTSALTAFSGQAPGIVKAHDGVCIYAGGDDLLALLPLDRALEAAAAVREQYRKAFSEKNPCIRDATISAGLVFAHYHCPLSQVLETARHHLKDTAKVQADRDAIAIAVLKPGGETCRWVGRFDHFKPPTLNGKHYFDLLIAKFREKDGEVGEILSSKFLYNLRARFKCLESIEDFGMDDIKKLFIAEFLHGKLDCIQEKAAQQRNHAENLMEKLLHVCRQSNISAPEGMRLDFDGARLVRFLALDGKEGNE